MKAIDLTGQRFGRLTVIERSKSTNKNAKWLCVCDCGNQKEVFGGDLKQGRTQSCGCIHSEQLAQRNFKHGLSNSRLHGIWNGMKARCYNPNFDQYADYGGRGITICREWRDDFQAFYDWAMANGYADNLTIDRIDNDGNYSPNNCRWATRQEQGYNRRDNRLITYNGETKTAAEWGMVTGIKPHTILRRLRLGWSVDEALTIRPKVGNNKNTRKAAV